MSSIITGALEEMGLLERLAGALGAIGAGITTIDSRHADSHRELHRADFI